MTALVRHRRPLLAAVCIFCTGLVFAAHWTGFEPLVRLGFATRDFLTRHARKAVVHPDIVFLAIDQSTVSADDFPAEDVAASPALQVIKNSGWPWSREVYPMIIDRLAQAGARAIVFDVLFPTEREGDDAFRAALERHRDRVIIGSNIVETPVTRTLTIPTRSLIPSGDPADPRVGYVNFWADLDGIVRRARFQITEDEAIGLPPGPDSRILYSLMGRTLSQTGRGNLVPPDAQCIRFASQLTPISLWTIFPERMWRNPPFNGGELFRDKIVLIGPVGNWSKDFIRTPLGEIPGPELHLQVLNAALNRDFIAEPSRNEQFAGILVAGFVAWVLSAFLVHPFFRFLVFILGSVGFFLVARFLFNLAPGGVLLSVAPPLIAANSSGLVWLIIEQVLDRLEKARTRRTLERYVSKDLVRDMLDNPASILNTLGGVRKPVAILFSDLRNFTAMMEAADSKQFVAQLNEYLTEMVKCIFDSKGTLDKFIGDAIMAVWGEVYTEGPAGDVGCAVSAALRMQAALADLNRRWEPRGLPPFRMGIGINYGPVIVGNIGATGATEKMELTVIGDPVNLASRLEGLTKQYNLDLVLGESAAELARGRFHLQFVDLVQVKGRTKPISVFTVTGAQGEALPQNVTDYLASYEEGLEHYGRAEFAPAIESFLRCLKFRPDDPLATLYLQRCRDLRENPPGPDWDGVFVMTRK
jgi:adenylate cyclase